MQSVSVFLSITKVAIFRWKNADVSRTQGKCHVIYVSFGYWKIPVPEKTQLFSCEFYEIFKNIFFTATSETLHL